MPSLHSRVGAAAATLTAQEVAALLRMHVKHVQRLARAGKLPARRVGRRWLFNRARIEALVDAPDGDAVPIALSARNQLRGRVVRLRVEGLMAEVELSVGGQSLVAIITRASAERLGVRPGREVLAVIKATEIMIGKG